MTFYAGAEGVTPTAHDTEEEAEMAAKAIGSKGQVWEIEDERDAVDDLRQMVWQVLADHQWADWSCSCGQVDPASRQWEDNHLADVLTAAIRARTDR